jgi:hypothetical protein
VCHYRFDLGLGLGTVVALQVTLVVGLRGRLWWYWDERLPRSGQVDLLVHGVHENANECETECESGGQVELKVQVRDRVRRQ